ncbi:MAG: hypothetical protein LBH35_06675 [Treponema sp.]|nr:hypothetical protein [Treponema sp.]
MKTDRAGFFLFAVLVPHRNAVFVIEQFRQKLFAAGFDGAFSFPAAAPLALLSRPLAGAELKAAAADLRKLLGSGKITLAAAPKESPALAADSFSPEGPSFFGPRLDMPFPALPASAVLARREKPVLAPAVLGRGGAERPCPAAELPSPPELSFRAAALANLGVYPAGNGEADYSYTWEMGRLYWLPNPAKIAPDS